MLSSAATRSPWDRPPRSPRPSFSAVCQTVKQSLGVFLLLNLALLSATATAPILRTSFESGQGKWVVIGESGSLRVSRDGADVREGKPSLAFDYEIGLKKFAAAILPVEPAALTGMDQIHFWAKTDFPTSIVVTVNEKGGGNYVAMAWSPGNVWQEIRLEPRDFALSDKGNDPPDPDGRLDTDQVQGIGVADFAELIGGAPRNPGMPMALADRAGKHTLLISEFEVLGGMPPRKDNLSVDQFDAPQISWLNPAAVALRIDNSRDHAPGPALEVDYTQAANALVYIGRNLPADIPPNITHISFDIASDKPAQFLFTLQEKGSGHGEGPRYSTVVEVRGKGKPDHRDLALRAFNLEQNGPPDPGIGLDIAKAKSLGIADVSPMLNKDTGPNRFWISNLRLIALE